MSDDEEKALLVEFVKWFAAKLNCEGRTRWPVVRDVEAFVASRAVLVSSRSVAGHTGGKVR